MRHDREFEAAGVLVELTDQRVHPVGVEGGPVEVRERGDDADVRRIALELPPAFGREFLDVVRAYPAGAGLERHYELELVETDPFPDDPDLCSAPIQDDRRDPVGDEHGCGKAGHMNARPRRLEEHADGEADPGSERCLADAHPHEAEDGSEH